MERLVIRFAALLLLFGGGIPTIWAQECKQQKVVTISSHIITVPPTGQITVGLKLEGNKTFSGLMGPGKSLRDLIRALRGAHTFDNQSLVPANGAIEVGKSQITLDIDKTIPIWEVVELIGRVLLFEIFPCDHNGGIKWKGSFSDPKRTQEWLRANA